MEAFLRNSVSLARAFRLAAALSLLLWRCASGEGEALVQCVEMAVSVACDSQLSCDERQRWEQVFLVTADDDSADCAAVQLALATASQASHESMRSAFYEVDATGTVVATVGLCRAYARYARSARWVDARCRVEPRHETDIARWCAWGLEQEVSNRACVARALVCGEDAVDGSQWRLDSWAKDSPFHALTQPSVLGAPLDRTALFAPRSPKGSGSDLAGPWTTEALSARDGHALDARAQTSAYRDLLSLVRILDVL